MHSIKKHSEIQKEQIQTLEGRKQLSTSMRFFRFFAVLVVPLYTILFATNDSLLHSNISKIGSNPEKQRSIICWGILCAALFYSLLSFLFMLTQYQSGHARRMLLAACSLLIVTVFIPFLPEEKPTQSNIHNATAMTASLLTLFVILKFILHLFHVDRHVFKRALIYWLSAASVCALLLFTTGISGLVEVVLIVSMSILLYLLLVWLVQSPRFDALAAYKHSRQPEEKIA